MNQRNKDKTRRFFLKPLGEDDLEHIAGWYEDIKDLSLIESRLSVPLGPRSLAKMWQNDLAPSEPGTDYLYSICEQDGDPVGHTGLQQINYANGNGVVFIYLRKDMRRSGIALRTTALMLDLAFFQLRLHRITTYLHSNNLPSFDLVKRLGFVEEGCMRDACFYDGRYGDVSVVGLLAEEWSTARQPLNDELDDGVRVAFGRDGETRWAWPLSRD